MDPIKHLIFFDGDCPLCNRAIYFILAEDREKIFGFAPLKGKTAEKEIPNIQIDPDLDTMVLLEDYGTEKEKVMIEGRAALRILWLLGGKYALLGWLSFLPSFLFDAIYRIVAKYRYRIFKTKRPLPSYEGRFLT